MSSNYWRTEELANTLSALQLDTAAQLADLQARIAALQEAQTAALLEDRINDTTAADAVQIQIGDLAQLVTDELEQAAGRDTIAGPGGYLPFGNGAGVDWRPIVTDDLASAGIQYGTAWPAEPIPYQPFYRTDLPLACIFNGVYWQALDPHWLTPDEIISVVALWHFSHRNGTTVFDNTQRARDLSGAGTPGYGFLTGRGAYANLNGTTQYFTNVSTDFGNIANFSAAAWYYVTGPLTTPQAIFSNDKTGTRGYMLSHGHDGRIHWEGNGIELAATGVQDQLSTWYLCWLTYAAGVVTVYRYETEAETTWLTGTQAIGTCADSFMLGRRAFTGFESPFAGRFAAPLFMHAAACPNLRLYKFLCERPLLT